MRSAGLNGDDSPITGGANTPWSTPVDQEVQRVSSSRVAQHPEPMSHIYRDTCRTSTEPAPGTVTRLPEPQRQPSTGTAQHDFADLADNLADNVEFAAIETLSGRPAGLPLQGFSMVAGVGFEPTTFGL